MLAIVVLSLTGCNPAAVATEYEVIYPVIAGIDKNTCGTCGNLLLGYFGLGVPGEKAYEILILGRCKRILT